MKNKTEMKWASFNSFELQIPAQAVEDCTHIGACDSDVAYWQSRIARPDKCTPEKLASELKDHGAWDAGELADDAANWRRIVWIACGNIKDEKHEMEAA